MKTNKSFAKRVKITKNGKVKTLAKGRSHYNQKERNATKMAKKKDSTIRLTAKVLSRVLPHHKNVSDVDSQNK